MIYMNILKHRINIHTHDKKYKFNSAKIGKTENKYTGIRKNKLNVFRLHILTLKLMFFAFFINLFFCYSITILCRWSKEKQQISTLILTHSTHGNNKYGKNLVNVFL